ncbi:UDP-N-acetylmuramate--L-alanine ligase [Cryobacterium sp. BB307]|uniref:UDP-N-acetylmuramate--L-alanine ligase n=1 Tax=Cryobacterium sp. BB307 TaxID=2716317 RepID=UPI0014453F20|nr:UDP-N-acetylmuramate--L-alanine ligase [Cryobacterium sp. BB307]
MIKSDFSQAFPDEHGTVHFVGIGGAGMSGIAALFVAAGIPVTGSDMRDTDTVAALRQKGVRIAIGHDAANVAGADTLVVSGAIAEDNPEYLAARERGLPTVHRARALAWLTDRHRVVAVAGAHGKTTSTAMIVTALKAIGADPSFVNGGVIRTLGVSAAPGADDLFVVEADESDGSFLLYNTAWSLITNVDPDHLDHFGSEQAFAQAFVDFASKAREGVVISADDAGAVAITPRLDGPEVVTFGTAQDAMVRVHSLDLGPTVSFTIRWRGADHPVRLRVPGLHNAINAAGAFGVLVGLGFAPERIVEGLQEFGGAERRFELRGEVRGIRVYDDFAHHPTELRAALSGARAVAGAGRVIPIFQPHLYSRTRMLAAEFAEVLETLADETIVVPIYGARQDPEPGVTGALITERFTDGARAHYIDDWDEAANFAASIARPGDILMPMGGGDIYRIVPTLIEALERAPDAT